MSVDQFFTPPATAQACWAWLQARPEIKALDDPLYIEPSAGTGSFYGLLPVDQRIGFELDPRLAAGLGVEQGNFLEVEQVVHGAPGEPLVFVGNPPFGPRGALALAFLNKAFELGADYVAMILPGAFRPTRAVPASCDSFVKLYHLQYGGGIAKHNERNAGRDRDCDVFIPQCLYRSSDAKASTSKDWNQCIGVKILRGGSRLRDYLLGYDWTREGRRSPTGQNHITRPIVHDVIVAGGFIDDGVEPGEPTLQPPVIERRIEGGYSIAYLAVPDEFDLPAGVKGNTDISGCAFVLYKRGVRPAAATGPLFGAAQLPVEPEIIRGATSGCDFYVRGDLGRPEVRDGVRASVEPLPKKWSPIGVRLPAELAGKKAALLAMNWKPYIRRTPTNFGHITKATIRKAILEAPEE